MSGARRTFSRGVMHAVVRNSRERSSKIGCRRRSSRNEKYSSLKEHFIHEDNEYRWKHDLNCSCEICGDF